MESEREYLSEMNIFKVISENRSIKYESKIFPEKGMSPKSGSSPSIPPNSNEIKHSTKK